MARWILAALVAGAVVAMSTSIWWLTRYSFAVRRLTRGVGDTVFYSGDGQPWFRLDEQRHDVPLDAIAPDLQHAVVAIEDRRFYYHPGIDPIGLSRALVHDVRSGERAEGGSTLTQQLARTLFLSNVRTFGRKAKEAALALLIEQQLTKNQILELYLNRVYLSAGVYGVDTMSEHLFRKPATALTLPEAAMIAGLIRAPSTLSPWSNYDGALDRSRLVLAAMRAQHFITPEQERAARAARPRVQPYRQATDVRGAWAKDYLRQQFRNRFGGDHPPDWQVHTTFLPQLQEAAERAVAAGVARWNRPGLEAALVAMDPTTGDLLAMVGGVDYRHSTYNRAVRSRRQPGSAFKPFVYAAALSRGLSPVSVLSNLRGLSVSTPADPEWAPKNVEGDVDSLTLRQALLESNNAAAVALQQNVGTRSVLQIADHAGLADLPDVPSLALGTGVVSPLDLTTAYTAFADGGEVVRPRGIVAVFDADGNQALDVGVQKQRVFSEQVAYQMVTMLQDVIDRGTGAAARTLGVRGAVGGKTGTTDEYHDAWFVGFSTSVVAGVWVGYDQPASIGRDAYAARVALPIWAEFMKRAARSRPPGQFVVPPDMRAEPLCRISYLRPVEECPVYTEYFKPGDAIPTQLCPIHRGTFKQRASRAVEGFFRSLGSRIAGLFGHR